jgi:hypothetical protein
MNLNIFPKGWHRMPCIRPVYKGLTPEVIMMLLLPGGLRLVGQLVNITKTISIRFQSLAPYCPNENSILD